MSARRSLVLMCGPAFSGKTSIARALAERGCIHVSLDEILRGHGLEPGSGLPVSAWEDASHEACARTRSLVSEGKSQIVIDDTLCFRFLRDRYRVLAAELNAAAILVVVQVRIEEIRRRAAENRANRTRGDVDPSVLEEHLASFEWPTAEESPIEICSAVDIDRVVAELELPRA